MAKAGLFYEDRARRVTDPSVARDSARFAQQIKTVDDIVNTLEEALGSQEINKSVLARAVGIEPSNVRRLFSTRGNPTLRTISDLAFELGFELQLVPISKSKKITAAASPKIISKTIWAKEKPGALVAGVVPKV